MSLSLLQSYSSAEEEEDDPQQLLQEELSTDDDSDDVVPRTNRSYKPLVNPNPPSSSSLPSAFDAFSEVSGPPQFLNTSVQEDAVKDDGGQRWRHGSRRHRKEKKDVPSVPKREEAHFLMNGVASLDLYSAVLESKPQLVGIHERVRSDMESNVSQAQSSGSAVSAQNGKRVASVANPNAEDAAELLRMCLRCGVPKTYSHAKGMICPMCGDRSAEDGDKEAAKKKGSAIKDKEKSKRMKGQSSHATWKSETEMHLRQQFD